MSISEGQHRGAPSALVRDSERSRNSRREGFGHGHKRDTFIGRLLGEEGVRTFRESIWEQATTVIASDGLTCLGADWPIVDEITEILAAVDIPSSNLDLADGSQPLAKGAYAPGGVIDRGKVLTLHDEGATIILRAAHRWSARLRRICAAIEWDFGFPTQANIYLTPPGRKSTPPHWDTHDLFIAQIAGAKTWRIYSSEHPLPLDSQRFSAEEFGVGPLEREIRLLAREVLYVPRGAIHEPVADSYSIHVSFGVLVSRWSDLLLTLVSEVAEQDPRLRRALSLPAGTFDQQVNDVLVEHLLFAIDALKQREACISAVKRHVASLLPRHTEDRRSQFQSSFAPVAIARTGLRRASSVYVATDATDSRLHVQWKHGQFSVPDRHQELIEHIVSGDVFTLDTTSHAAEEERAFCHALVRDGFLEYVTETSENATEDTRLRTACAKDRVFILDAETETAQLTFGRQSTGPEAAQRRGRLDAALHAGDITVAELNGTPAGYCWMEARPDGTWFVVDFFVDPAQRGSHFAMWLFDTVIRTRIGSSSTIIRLVVADANVRAVKFFSRYGAQALGDPSPDGLREYELLIEKGP